MVLEFAIIVTGRKAGFRSLGDAWADTIPPHGRLMFAAPGGLPELQRDLIRARTNEGRERAKARGVKPGRKPNLTAPRQRGLITRRDNGEAAREIVCSYNMHHSTISRLAARG